MYMKSRKKGWECTARSFSVVAVSVAFFAGGSPGRGQSRSSDPVASGIQALKGGEFTHAEEIFAELVKLSPSGENIAYLAMAEAGLGNLGQAIVHFQQSIRLGNNSAPVHYNLGIAYLKSGRQEEGIRELRAAITRDQRFVPARYPLGVALLQKGRPREALPYLAQATELLPHDVDDKAALQTADRAVGAIPNSPRLAVALAGLCLQHGQARRARQLLEDANASDPRNPSIALLLARVSLQIGEPKEALAVLENVPPEAGAPGEVMLLKGEARALAGDFALAEVDLGEALNADPGSLRYLMANAWLQQLEGHYQEALATLNNARKLDEHTPFIPYRMALSYYFLHLNERALEACEDAIRLDPHYPPTHFLLGTIKLQEKEFQGAQQALRQAIRLRPGVGLFHLVLGVALYRAGALTDSRNELGRALTLAPEVPQSYFYRGQIFALEGQRRKAIADLETAVALEPHFKEAYAKLAQLYAAEGQSQKAAEASAKDAAEFQSDLSDDDRMMQQLRRLPATVGGLGLDIR